MGTDLLEHNELSPLAERYSNVVGAVGVGVLMSRNSKARKIGKKLSNSPEADDAFKSKMITLYKKIKGNRAHTNKALSNIEQEDGVQAVWLATKEFGFPSQADNAKKAGSLELHNIAVEAHLKYFVPYEAATTQDCANLESLMQLLDTEIKGANEYGLAGGRKEVTKQAVLVYQNIRKQVELVYQGASCERRQESETAAKEEAKILDTLKKATEDGGEEAKTLLGGKNTMLYAGVGLVVLIGVFMLLKKK